MLSSLHISCSCVFLHSTAPCQTQRDAQPRSRLSPAPMGRGQAPLVTAALLVLSLARAAPSPAPCPPGSFLPSAAPGCKPCPADTFSSQWGSREACTLCRRCEGKFKYKRQCSSTSDAECTCQDGQRCIRNDCSKCVKNCAAGEEPNEEGCRTCPHGTFNHQPNGPCRQWTKCLTDKILVNGTNSSDVVCGQISETMTLTTTSIIIPVHVQGKDLHMVTIGVAVTVAAVVCIMFLLPLCVCFSIYSKKKLPALFKKMNVIPEQSTQEEDACSCRFPEEEQGDCDDCSKSKLFKDSLVN
ncbi:tumor necrosis factor receptor superfamily member 9 isoform X1 [Pelodiscus sinensis]|uniref:tumor necrosis factor receptor superfamily member 9 isoform X1 n=2 Tax=Pelodiscus sinensis TaxID=13735 RepID=UPI003F6CD89C